MTSRPEPFDAACGGSVYALLKAARRRWFAIVWLRLATEAALVASVAVLCLWTVVRLSTPGPNATLALSAVAMGVAMLTAAWRARPLLGRPSDRQVARYVEEHVPSLDEALVAAVGCLERPSSASTLAGPLLASAAAQLEGVDVDAVVPAEAIRNRTLQLGGAVAVLMLLLVTVGGPLLQALDVFRMAIFPPSITLEVAPGDLQVREGSQVHVRARVNGLPARIPRETLTMAVEVPGRRRTVPMSAAGDWQDASLDDVRSSFAYQVSGQGLTSRTYRVDVKPRPRVARIDLSYEFPSFSGLRPRVDADTGDIYAPAGTKVRWTVRTTVPVAQASIGLSSGAAVPLTLSSSPQVFEGQMVVTRNDAYRLTLLESDGFKTPDDTEYFVRTVDDRPPDVRIQRPAGDRRVTRLEEVVIEARADDDFGIDRLELVYAARGGVEKAVRLGGSGQKGTTVSGRHTVFVEDLDVQPGDFVSYYARARDVGRGKRSTETRSDIFFLEVRPFNEEFEAAQSAAMQGGAGSAFDDLAARQKELIIATWKLERRSVAGRSADDIRALAKAQGELKAKAAQLAGRVAPRPAAQRRPGSPPPPAAGENPMRRAVDAMDRSQKALEALQTGQAIPHEMDALNQLLRAQAEIQRRQVTQQQSAGGRGGETGNQDLSALFDRELQRQQQTKYENRSSVEQSQEKENQSDSLERLRELARRQDEMSQRQQELARQQQQMAAEEVKRQLERLTREQEELRREAEQLAAQLQQQRAAQQNSQPGQQQPGGQPQQGQEGQQGKPGQQASSSGQSSGSKQGGGGSRSESELQAAAEAMREASGGLSREQLKEAAEQAQRAAERLRQAARELGRQEPDEASRVAGDLQLEAAELAEAQRRLARQLRDGARPGGDRLRQMAGEQERAAERAGRLARRAADQAEQGDGDPAGNAGGKETPERNGSSGKPGTSAAAAGTNTNGAPRSEIAQVESQLRASAQALRQMADRGEAGAGRQREAERSETIARNLESVARSLGRGPGDAADRDRLSEQLARAGELRDRLAELTRQLRERQEGRAPGTEDSRSGQPGKSGQQGQPGQPQGQPGNQGQPSDATGQEGQPSAAEQSGGNTSGGTASGSPQGSDVGGEVRALGRLARGLGEGEGTDRLQRALETLEGYAPSLSAPGTEAWKQDFAKWESLRKEISESLEQLESDVSAQLRTEERENRLDAGGSESTPDAYRREVAKYYRSLARKPQS